MSHIFKNTYKIDILALLYDTLLLFYLNRTDW